MLFVEFCHILFPLKYHFVFMYNISSSDTNAPFSTSVWAPPSSEVELSKKNVGLTNLISSHCLVS